MKTSAILLAATAAPWTAAQTGPFGHGGAPPPGLGGKALSRPPAAPPACRDRFLQPFASTSIWNTPIGSLAAYVPAGIYPNSSTYPLNIHNDQDWILRASPADPLVDWIDDSGNFPGLCSAKGPVRTQLPLPVNATTDCVPNNNGAGLLMPDNITLVQFQPFYRPAAGGPMIAWYHTGAPQPFEWEQSILGNGTTGAHGGSGLSSFGGAIRLGELLEASPPIAHALKLELWAHRYYYLDWATKAPGSCFTWPAVGCDSYAFREDIGYNGTNPFLKPGALLAVPPALAPSVAAKLTTVPARRMLQALTDYGGYVVDDTGSERGGGAFCAERGVNAEVEAVYNFSIAIENPLTPTSGAAFYDDLVTLYSSLSVVTNNGPDSVGGGGTPRQPPAAPICGA